MLCCVGFVAEGVYSLLRVYIYCTLIACGWTMPMLGHLVPFFLPDPLCPWHPRCLGLSNSSAPWGRAAGMTTAPGMWQRFSHVGVCVFGDSPCEHMFNFLWRGEKTCQMRLILETGEVFFRRQFPWPCPAIAHQPWEGQYWHQPVLLWDVLGFGAIWFQF